MAALTLHRGKKVILMAFPRIGLVLLRQDWHASAQQKPEAALWTTN
jgi:hypothetical protein